MDELEMISKQDDFNTLASLDISVLRVHSYWFEVL